MTTSTPFIEANGNSASEAPFSFSVVRALFVFLKLLEFLSLAALLISGGIAVAFPAEKRAVIAGGISLAALVFFFFTNQLPSQFLGKTVSELTFQGNAKLYLRNLGESGEAMITPIVLVRAQALQYCQVLIDDYTKTRNQSRNFYYVLQLATVILSGVTPILVLVDKLEAGQVWLKWLPVICPALASIVASVVTSFPFQKNWVNANTIVELLEAEREKFILGVTPEYRCYDSADTVEAFKKAQQAIENFIIQVNNIHLKQVQRATESEATPSKTASESSGQEQPVVSN